MSLDRSLYVCPDSTISAIGGNYFYQLGDGTNIERNVPVKVKGLHSVVSVNAEGSMALLADGTLWQWARATFSNGGMTTNWGYELKQMPVDNVEAVTCGSMGPLFYCALLKDKSLRIWSDYPNIFYHQNAYTDSIEKVSLPKVKKVTAGSFTILALCEDSTVWTWGNIRANGNIGGVIPWRKVPVKVKSLSKVTDIAAGSNTVYALKEDGTVWGWGRNVDIRENDDSTFVHKLQISDVKSIFIGSDFQADPLYAIKHDGTVWHFKDSLSTVFSDTAIIPVKEKMITNAEVIATDGYYRYNSNFALDTYGNTWRWGCNWHGQLGNFTTLPIDTPEIMPHPCTAVDCGSYVTNPETLKLDTFVYRNSTVSLHASDGQLFWWYPQRSGLACKYCQDNTVKFIARDSAVYFAVIMDLYGCQRKEWFKLHKKCDSTLFYNPKLVLDTVTFPNNPITLKASDNVSYSWQPTAGLSCNNCKSTIANVSRSTSFIVSIVDTSNCPLKEKFKVRIRDCDTIAINNGKLLIDTLIVPGSRIQLKADNAETYAWSPPIGLSCTGCQTPKARIYQNTEYTATLIDKLHCQWTERFRLTNHCDSSTLVSPKIGFDSIAYPGLKIVLSAPFAKSYEWQPSNYLSCNDCKNPALTISQPSEYIVNLTDSFNCISKEKYILKIRDCDTIVKNNGKLLVDTLIVPGSRIQLKADNAETYTWLPPAGLSCTACQSPKARIYQNTEYTATLIDKLHCQWTERFRLTNHCDSSTLVNPKIGFDSIAYPGLKIVLSAPQAVSYGWQPQTDLSCNDCKSPTFTVSQSSEYTVNMTDSFHCVTKEKYRLKIRNCDTIVLNDNFLMLDTTIYYTGKVSLKATSSITSYVWAPTEGLSCSDCQAPTFFVDKSMEYVVSIADKWRCPYTEHFKITFIDISITVPNVFTPNGDGINDFFEIKGLPPYCSLKILNNKGEIIYSSDNYQNDWDGRGATTEGTYYYLLSIPQHETYKGWVYVKK